MSNNLACYPLLRSGRKVDILLAFDSSADIQTANWLGFAEGYAKQRKIQGWPISIGWPKEGTPDESLQKELEDAQAYSTTEATEKLKEAQRENEEVEASKPVAQRRVEQKKKSALGYCTVWVGSKEERSTDEEPPPSKAVEEDWELMQQNAGSCFHFLNPHPSSSILSWFGHEFMSFVDVRGLVVPYPEVFYMCLVVRVLLVYEILVFQTTDRAD